jgi:hypothetical protein
MKNLIAGLLLLVPGVCFADLTGEWSVVGKDNSGTKWVGTLVLNPDKERPRDEENDPDAEFKTYLPVENYEGYFDWEGDNGTGGREYVRAKYNPKDGSLKMGGTTLENADPNIIQAVYMATLAKDRLEDGSWDGVGVVAGKWKGKRKVSE